MDDALGQKARETGSLRNRTLRAGGWTFIGHFISLVLRMVASLILTRIFAPDTFGILAIIGAISAVIGMLTHIGIRQAIIQSPNGGTAVFLNTAWTLQILRGVVIWALNLLAAFGLYIAGKWEVFPAGSVYAEKRLPLFVVVASFSAIILGFQSMKAIVANRDLDLKSVTAIEVLSQLAGLAFVIPLGWATRSIWVYIASLLLTPLAFVFLSCFWLKGPADRIAWNRDALAELRRFGKWVFLSSSLSAAALNGDRLLLAAWVSPTVLGYFSLANNFVSIAVVLAGKIYANVAMPALSEVYRSNPENFKRLLSRMRWISDPIMLLGAGFLFATGSEIIALLYDSRYAGAGPILQWLSFSLVFARYDLAFNGYLALGRPHYFTAISLTKLVSLFTFVPVLFYMFGVEGAILGIACHMFPATFWLLYFNRRRGIQNLRLEAAVLSGWPIGYIAGLGILKALGFLKFSLVVH